MESTRDELGYFRERAAAARAKAEEAAQFPRQREAWVQVAEKWERLASRAESKPAAAAAETAAPISGHDDRIDPAELTRHLSGAGASQRDEVGGGTVRRRAVLAGFLLLSVLTVAAFWPTDKRATTVEENPANAPARFEPQLRASNASGGPAAQAETTTARAEPSAGPDLAAQVVPVPERIAEAPAGPIVHFVAPAEPPPEPLPEAPAPAGPTLDLLWPPEPAPPRVAEAPVPTPPEILMSETGSVGQRPEPEPDLPPSQAAVVALVRQEIAAPDPKRLSPRTSESTREAVVPREQLTGISLPRARRKLIEHRSTLPVARAQKLAHSRLGTCTSLTKTQAGRTWTVVAECSDARVSWPARIRLVLIRKRERLVPALRSRPSTAPTTRARSPRRA